MCRSDMADTTAAATYGSYLKIDELLSLQQPRSEGPEHDEMLFIVIHQVYELWFKELLHEFDRVMRCSTGDEPHRAQHTLKRILTILKVLVAQLDILETMTPLEFLSVPRAARGGERVPVGSVPPDRVRARRQERERASRGFPRGAARAQALERATREPTLWDAFLHYLAREGYAVPAAQLSRDVTARDRAVGRDAADPRSTSIAATRRTPSCASGWWISTKGCRSGATAT